MESGEVKDETEGDPPSGDGPIFLEREWLEWITSVQREEKKNKTALNLESRGNLAKVVFGEG